MSTFELNVLVYVNKQAHLVVSAGEHRGAQLPCYQRKYCYASIVAGESNPVIFPVGSDYWDFMNFAQERVGWICTEVKLMVPKCSAQKISSFLEKIALSLYIRLGIRTTRYIIVLLA